MDLGGPARDAVRAMLARRSDPYEGADLATSRRVTAALLGLSALLTLAFLPLDPPSERIGWYGWIVAVALVAASAAIVPRLIGEHSVGFRHLLAVAYAGVAQIALLKWLAGTESPYDLMYLLWLGAGAVHPPRKAFLHLLTILAVLPLPLVYDGYDSGLATSVAARGMLLLAVGTVLIAYLFVVRRQRAGLRLGVEVARRLAGTDPLTGLGNRRSFDESLIVEIARAEREGKPLSVALVDLDNLKRINDRYGHLEGDRCLRQAGREMEKCLRASDRCYRWGGDEFAIVLPNTDRAGALNLIRRMVEQVGTVCADEDGLGAQLSFGVGELEPGVRPEDLLAMADLALLDQKTEKRR